MKKITFLFLILLTTVCNSQTIKEGWNCFDGYVFENDVVVNIYRDSIGHLTGDYCYKKYETQIPLKGKLNGNKIILEEFTDNKMTAKFNGEINEKDNTITGKWLSTTHSDKVFFLKLNSWTGNSIDNRYSMGSDNEEVESFFKKIKEAILTDDKIWLSKNTKFPITLYDGKKKLKIKNAKDFLSKYTITKPFKKSIQEACICDIFSNWRGAMFANGAVWINKYDNGLKISSINN